MRITSSMFLYQIFTSIPHTLLMYELEKERSTSPLAKEFHDHCVISRRTGSRTMRMEQREPPWTPSTQTLHPAAWTSEARMAARWPTTPWGRWGWAGKTARKLVTVWGVRMWLRHSEWKRRTWRGQWSDLSLGSLHVWGGRDPRRERGGGSRRRPGRRSWMRWPTFYWRGDKRAAWKGERQKGEPSGLWTITGANRAAWGGRPVTPASTSTTATGLASTTLRWPTSENVRKKMTKLEKKKKLNVIFLTSDLGSNWVIWLRPICSTTNWKGTDNKTFCDQNHLHCWCMIISPSDDNVTNIIWKLSQSPPTAALHKRLSPNRPLTL